jgi:anti-anti-sigma factor
MKTPTANTLFATSRLRFDPTPECLKPSAFKTACERRDPSQSFSLFLTTIHPGSADARAGEVACVPVEFAQGAILLDLQGVTRIDSCGLALFLEAMQRMAARGGRLFLTRIDPQVRHVLETAKLDRVFHIAATREDALAELGQWLAV